MANNGQYLDIPQVLSYGIQLYKHNFKWTILYSFIPALCFSLCYTFLVLIPSQITSMDKSPILIISAFGVYVIASILIFWFSVMCNMAISKVIINNIKGEDCSYKKVMGSLKSFFKDSLNKSRKITETILSVSMLCGLTIGIIIPNMSIFRQPSLTIFLLLNLFLFTIYIGTKLFFDCQLLTVMAGTDDISDKSLVPELKKIKKQYRSSSILIAIFTILFWIIFPFLLYCPVFILYGINSVFHFIKTPEIIWTIIFEIMYVIIPSLLWPSIISIFVMFYYNIKCQSEGLDLQLAIQESNNQ